MVNPEKHLLVTNKTHVFGDKRNRKPYRKPQLENLGDLRTLTLGGSPGIGESGFTPRKPRTGLPQPGDIPVFNPDGTIYNPDEPNPTP